MSTVAKPPPSKAPPWSLVSALLTVFVLFVCLVVVGPSLASIALGSAEFTSSLLLLSWSLGFVLASVFVIVNRRSRPDGWRALAFARGKLPLPIALLIGVAVALGLDLIVGLASGVFLPAPEIAGFNPADVGSLVLSALLLIALQPTAETLVFQAVLLPALGGKLGPRAGIAVAAALYVIFHFLVFASVGSSSYDVFWHGVVYPAGIGLGFSALRVRSGSTSATLLARMAAGAAFFLTALALFGA